MKTFKELVKQTKKTKREIDIPLAHIHREGSIDLEQYKDTDKVEKMREALKNRKKLKPVEVTRMTDTIRKEQGVADINKKWFMIDGNHRYAAHHFEGKTHINATNYYVGEKLK